MNGDSTQMTDDMTGDAGRAASKDGDADMDVTLDLQVPEIEEAFRNAKEGDMYMVKSADDMNIVLTKQPSEEPESPPTEEGADTPGADTTAEPTSDNPAIAALIVKKNKS